MLVIMKSCDMKILQRSSVRRRSRIRWLLVSVWWVTLLPALTGTEIAFTVQGRLTDEGKPAGGLYDFHFALKPAPEGETLAEWLERGVPVRDGLFTVPVAFRPAFFDVFALTADDPLEEARYLEVSVRPASLSDETARGPRLAALSPGFITLRPALRITPAPTAIHAATATAVIPGAITPAALTLSPAASGLVTVAAGAFSVQPLPPPAWSLAGNAGTTVADFLGTTDSRPLEVRVARERALLIEPGAVAPNLIGGHASNAAPAASGAVIGGGGAAGEPNLAAASHAFIGGGRSNYVSGTAAVIAGGSGNAATNAHAVVSGGQNNFARGGASTVSGGAQNQATQAFASVGGGQANLADGPAATVAGGDNNVAGLPNATVGGGGANQAVGGGATVGGGLGNRAELDLATVSGGGENWARDLGATVGGGVGNQAHGVNSTVAGGGANRATGAYSSIPGGTQALAAQHGQMAQSAGVFADLGDAQTSVLVLRGQTSVAAPSGQLSLDGQGTRLKIEPGQTFAFEVLLAGRSEGVPPNFSVSGGYTARGVIRNVAGTVSFVGTPVVVELGEDDPAWSLTVYAGPDHLGLEVNSAATPDIVRWVARVETAEVAWFSSSPVFP